MSWPASLVLGLVTGLVALLYGGIVADLSVPWLRISSFEGASGYWVVGMAILAFLIGTPLGIIVCRLAGRRGVGRGFAVALASVVGPITLLGALAWLQRDVAPLVAGAPLDLAVEVRLPPGLAPPEAEQDRAESYVTLTSGTGRRQAIGGFHFAEAMQDGDGRWVVPAQVRIHVTAAPRILGVKLGSAAPTQFFDTTIPARPRALDADWGAWLSPYLGNREPPPADAALQARLRVVQRPPPEPPAADPPPEPAPWATLPAPDAPTEDWMERTALAAPAEIRAQAIRVATARPDFLPLLLARIASPDHAVARDGMYLIGEMHPAPAAAGDAVRARAAEVVRIAEAIDPAAADSQNQLYAQAHVLWTGVIAASFGLRRAGVDLRPELRAMAAAARPRETDTGGDIWRGSTRVADHFDKEAAAAAAPRPVR